MKIQHSATSVWNSWVQPRTCPEGLRPVRKVHVHRERKGLNLSSHSRQIAEREKERRITDSARPRLRIAGLDFPRPRKFPQGQDACRPSSGKVQRDLQILKPLWGYPLSVGKHLAHPYSILGQGSGSAPSCDLLLTRIHPLWVVVRPGSTPGPSLTPSPLVSSFQVGGWAAPAVTRRGPGIHPGKPRGYTWPTGPSWPPLTSS